MRRSFAAELCAWNSGRLDVIREYFTEDAVLHFAGNNAMSGTYRGREAVMEVLARASQGWGTQTDVDSVLASDDHMTVFYHATDEREGAVMAMKADADGKLTEAWFLSMSRQHTTRSGRRCPDHPSASAP